MHAPTIPSTTTEHRSRFSLGRMFAALPVFAYFRGPWRRTSAAKRELREGSAMLWDAQASMRCGNPARSLRVMSEWLKSRGDQPEDYGWLSTQIIAWEDRRVMSWLTETRITRLLTLKRSTEALSVIAERLRADPRFRPISSADTLSLAQLAARSGAQRISQILLSDFSARFPADPRISVVEALKRRLAQPASARMRA